MDHISRAGLKRKMLATFTIKDLITRNTPGLPELDDMQVNFEIMRRGEQYSQYHLELCLEYRRYTLFKHITRVSPQIRLRDNLFSIIMKTKNMGELKLIMATHMKELINYWSSVTMQICIYMCSVHDEPSEIKQIIRCKNGSICKNDMVIYLYRLFIGGITNLIQLDKRLSACKFANKVITCFPKYVVILQYVFGIGPLASEILNFVQSNELTLVNVQSHEIQIVLDAYGFEETYKLAVTDTKHSANNYLRLLELGMNPQQFCVPHSMITFTNVVRLLSRFYNLHEMPCRCGKKVIECTYTYVSFNPDIAQCIPPSHTKQYIRIMPLDYVIYYVKRHDFSINFVIGILMENITYGLKHLPNKYAKEFDTLIDCGLCFDPRVDYTFLDDDYEDKQLKLRHWLFKRPEDAASFIGLGLKLDMDVLPYIPAEVVLDIPLFGLDIDFIHAITFQINVRRVDDYIRSTDVCTNGAILVCLRRDNYVLHALPLDIIKIIHSYLR